MKNLRIPLLLTVALAWMSFTDITDEISLAFKAGNAEAIIKHCANQVDLTILDNNNMYARAEAKSKLNAFFDQYPPKDFRIIHQGESKSGLQYTIGTLITETKQFRVSFYIKTQNETPLIQQLMIDAIE